MKKQKPILIIANNTTADININVLTADPGLKGIINSSIRYQWDTTLFPTTQLTTVMLQVKTTAAGPYTTLTATIGGSSVNDIINALNSLKVGWFYSQTILGIVYIVSFNSYYIYGDISVNSNVPHWIGTHNILFGAGVVFPVAHAYSDFDSTPGRIGTMYSHTTTPVPLTIADSFNTPVAVGQLQQGDLIQLLVFTVTVAANFTFTVKQDGVIVMTDTALAHVGPYLSPTFPWNFNSIYDITGSVT